MTDSLRLYLTISVAILFTTGFVITGIIAVNWLTVSRRTQIWSMIDRFGNNKESFKNTQAQEMMGFQLNRWQRFEKRYCQDTGLWSYWPWFSPVLLLMCCIITGLGLAKLTWFWFGVEGLVVSGFILGVIAPLQGLNLWQAYRSYQLTCALPSFYGVLCRWAQIQPDIYFCFSQLPRSGLPHCVTEPFIKFLKASTGGMTKEIAFSQLSQQVEGTPLRHFIRCLERLIDHRGDLPKLLQGFEAEAYQLQHEVTKRKMTQLKYKLLINGLCVGSFVLIYTLLKTNRVLSSFYAETWAGKTLLSMLAGLLVLSFVGGLHYDEMG